mmetsp:Transcript_79473/g.178023  ORF Transcript_79473/g.178023 Transcript_79473/m.178023 type:complete len:302 (+) Transcript_79473:1-906(+)
MGDRSRSRSPAAIRPAHRQDLQEGATRHQPFLCLLVGGPGSGKSLLGTGLQRSFPRLVHASGGDIARLATTNEARQSPLLNSISRQLEDERRRKVALRRLADFVTATSVEILKRHSSLAGLIVDGVRAADLQRFEEAHGSHVACIIQIDCSRDTMKARLSGRASREGDSRLGLADGKGDDPVTRELFNLFQTGDRVDAFLKRAAAEEESLRSHMGERYQKVVFALDGELSREQCLESASEVVRKAAKAVFSHHAIAAGEEEVALVDWPDAIRATAARLDLMFYPDGRPRATSASQSQHNIN